MQGVRKVTRHFSRFFMARASFFSKFIRFVDGNTAKNECNKCDISDVAKSFCVETYISSKSFDHPAD